MEKTAVIFDLDGTLWDSVDVLVEGWNFVIGKYENLRPMTQEILYGYMGKTIYEIADIQFDNMPLEERHDVARECAREATRFLGRGGTNAYSGIEDMFKALSKKHEIYIVSNCEDGYIDAFLKNHKMGEYINDREFSGRTGLTKGENIKMIMERNSITKAVYVGDTMGDYIATKAAGIDFIFVSYGFGDVKEAKYVAKNTKDVVKFVEEIL